MESRRNARDLLSAGRDTMSYERFSHPRASRSFYTAPGVPGADDAIYHFRAIDRAKKANPKTMTLVRDDSMIRLNDPEPSLAFPTR